MCHAELPTPHPPPRPDQNAIVHCSVSMLNNVQAMRRPKGSSQEAISSWHGNLCCHPKGHPCHGHPSGHPMGPSHHGMAIPWGHPNVAWLSQGLSQAQSKGHPASIPGGIQSWHSNPRGHPKGPSQVPSHRLHVYRHVHTCLHTCVEWARRPGVLPDMSWHVRLPQLVTDAARLLACVPRLPICTYMPSNMPCNVLCRLRRARFRNLRAGAVLALLWHQERSPRLWCRLRVRMWWLLVWGRFCGMSAHVLLPPLLVRCIITCWL